MYKITKMLINIKSTLSKMYVINDIILFLITMKSMFVCEYISMNPLDSIGNN
jgi:hypothetical protein